MNVLISVFTLFVKLGVFSFGGGYAIMSLLFVENSIHEIVTENQLTSIVALAQSLPGPFAINTAIGYGFYATNGPLGSLVAVLGIVIPCLIIMFLVIHFVEAFKHNKIIRGIIYGITPAVIGVIGGAAYKLMDTSHVFADIVQILLVAISLVLFVKTKIHPIFLILAGGIIGILLLK